MRKYTVYEIANSMLEHPAITHEYTFDARLKLEKDLIKLLNNAKLEKWAKIKQKK